MQAIHTDEHVYNDDHVYNVRRDGPWDAGSDAAPVCAFSNSPGTDLRVWDHLMPCLPASRRVFRYDTAGHGLSDFPGAMPLGDHADDLRALLDACGVESRVVGLSVGGLIGQALSFLVRFVPVIPIRCNTPQSLL